MSDEVHDAYDDLEQPTMSAHVNVAALFKRAEQSELAQGRDQPLWDEKTVAYGTPSAVDAAIEAAEREADALLEPETTQLSRANLPLPLPLPLPPVPTLKSEAERDAASEPMRFAVGSCKFPLLVVDGDADPVADDFAWLAELGDRESLAEQIDHVPAAESEVPKLARPSALVMALRGLSAFAIAAFVGLGLSFIVLAGPYLPVPTFSLPLVGGGAAALLAWLLVGGLVPRARWLRRSCALFASLACLFAPPMAVAIMWTPLAVVIASSAFLLAELRG